MPVTDGNANQVQPIGKQTDGAHLVSRPLSSSLRLLYTFFIFLAWFAYGVIISQLGPSMVDLRYLLNGNTLKHIATLKAVSLLFTFASAGTFLGGIISFLYTWSLSGPYVNRQLLTSLLLCLLGLSVASLPRLQHLWLLYGVSFAGFIGGGNHGAVAITWLAELWTGRVLAALMQAFQLSYGVGSIVGPLLARPYLWGLLNQTTLEELSDSEYWSTVEERRNSLAVPFTISGCLMGFVGLSLFLLYVLPLSRYHSKAGPQVKGKTQELPDAPLHALECPHQKTRLRAFLFSMFILFGCSNLAEFSFISFLDPFLQSLPSLSVSAAEAAAISALYATSYTTGRAISILVSLLLSPTAQLLLHYGLAFLGLVGLIWASGQSLVWVRVCVLAVGYGNSAILPSLFTFTAKHTLLGDTRNGLYSIAIHAPSILTPIFIGPYLQSSPAILLYLDLAVVLFALAVFGILHCSIILPNETPKTNKTVGAIY